MGDLADKVKNMKERGHCPDCANIWWFDLPESWVCTTCAKTIGKATSEEETQKSHD